MIMAAAEDILENKDLAFESIRLDLSQLVGQDINIYSEQIPGKKLVSRVMAVSGNQVQINQAGEAGLIENLVNNQKMVLQFAYREQEIAVRAQFKKGAGGRCYLILDEKVMPLMQRKYVRVGLVRPVKLAAFPLTTFSNRNIARLRWIQMETINFSSGGILLNISSYLEKGVHLLLNIDVDEPLLPPLVLGRVCHCYQGAENSFKAGVEFVVRERGSRMFTPDARKTLPPAIFEYTSVSREKLNKIIKAWKQ
ncbi:MAG: hypothetical protein JXA92_03855 [candidate division Zixibacteria bacterium]|nr:hypothetical protein [candidate division Zixibacteria bacterium]